MQFIFVHCRYHSLVLIGIDLNDFGAHFTHSLIFLSLHRMATLGVESTCHRFMPELTSLENPSLWPWGQSSHYVVLILRAFSFFSSDILTMHLIRGGSISRFTSPASLQATQSMMPEASHALLSRQIITNLTRCIQPIPVHILSQH
jgi:hypothetical protein